LSKNIQESMSIIEIRSKSRELGFLRARVTRCSDREVHCAGNFVRTERAILENVDREGLRKPRNKSDTTTITWNKRKENKGLRIKTERET